MTSEIETPRLSLVLMTEPVLEGLLAEASPSTLLRAGVPPQWPDEADRWLLQLRLEQMRTDPGEAPWLLRAVIERAGGAMVGHVGFHGRPDDTGAAEIGYTIFADHRRQGYAEEAATALMEWARRAHGVTTFRASAAPTNAPSLAMLAKLGFRRTGTQWDDIDGEETVFHLDVAPATTVRGPHEGAR